MTQGGEHDITAIQQLVTVLVLRISNTVWGEDCSSVTPVTLRRRSAR